MEYLILYYIYIYYVSSKFSAAKITANQGQVVCKWGACLSASHKKPAVGFPIDFIVVANP